MKAPARKTYVWVGIVVIFLVMAIRLLGRPEDPLFEGKRLSEHLEAFQNRGLHHGGIRPPRIELTCWNTNAYRAIRAVGTNGLPMLVEMLGSTDRIHRWYEEFADRNPWIKKYLTIKPSDAWKRVGQAMAAFTELGPRAAPALPEVIRLLHDPQCGSVAVVALLAIQPEREQDILSLTNVLRITRTSASGSRPDQQHADGIMALSTFGPRASGARAVLLDCLRSRGPLAQATAAVALARIGAPPEEVVPLVLNRLPTVDTPAGPARMGAVTPAAMIRMQQLMEAERIALIQLSALGEFGPAASAALPALESLGTHPNSAIAAAARDAISRIKTATNAPRR